MTKKVRISAEEDEGEDRISKLSDELIHKIMGYLGDTRLAVQTSILSNRWKLIWRTLPFLSFKGYGNLTNDSEEKFCKFIDHVLSNRNFNCNILKLELRLGEQIPKNIIIRVVKYASRHKVQDLYIKTDHCCKLAIFKSYSLKKFKLKMDFGGSTWTNGIWESDFWSLPELTNLHLINEGIWKLPESCLRCLPALRVLRLDCIDIPNSLSLPKLKSLHLVQCKMPQAIWYLPGLSSLELDDVVFPQNLTEFLSVLVSLQNLTLDIGLQNVKDLFISCPQLLNLKIRSITCTTRFLRGNILVLAPKLCNLDCVGVFSITCGASALENVNIKLRGCFADKSRMPLEELRQYYHRLTFMFQGLGNAKILTLDLETLEALSEVSDLLAHFPSPFYNLKYVKLRQGCKESSLSMTTKSYLLGGSLRATIVTTLPQKDEITHMEPVSLTTENVVFDEPSTTATKELIGSQYMHKQVLVDSSYGLWQGYEVNSEFVDLLDRIMKKYPETFENFTSKNKKLCTMKLNMLCASVNDFTKTSMTEVSLDMIAEYKELCADLQRSFDVKWLLRRLNYIEHLRFSNPLLPELHAIDSHIHGAESHLQDLQARTDDTRHRLEHLHTLRIEKMTEIEKTFGSMGTVLAAGCIGDDLFGGP